MIKSRKLRWEGHVARMGEGRSAFEILTNKPTRKRPLGRSRRSWKNNIINYFKEIGVSTRNLIDSAQNRAYWRALVNLRVP